jgi:HSP20 family protein
VFSPSQLNKVSTWRPAVEVKQNDKNYKIKVQLPGIKKDDIVVEMDNDFMTIKAETHEEREEEEQKEKNERLHTSEFRYGKYMRTISFDQPVISDKADADYKDGILTITVPKQKEQVKEPKKLTIK